MGHTLLTYCTSATLISIFNRLFIAGCQPDVNAIFPTLEYPAPRGTPSISPLATWDHSLVCTTISPMADKPLSQLFIPVKLSKGNEYSFIKAHRVKGYEVIPPSLYLVCEFIVPLVSPNVRNS